MPVERTNNFGAISQQILANTRMGVARAGERLLAVSAAEVPLDQGTLMGSGAVSTPLGGEDIEAQVVYDTPYAARLHEHPEYNFQGGRKGKYLEDPAMENKNELLAIIAKEAGHG
ncbi:MAG: hypothetical protein U1E32_10445 [Rhodoglobus sp.]|nr:hypothetical protein [Rhodoglobus sp.]